MGVARESPPGRRFCLILRMRRLWTCSIGNAELDSPFQKSMLRGEKVLLKSPFSLLNRLDFQQVKSIIVGVMLVPCLFMSVTLQRFGKRFIFKSATAKQRTIH